VTSPLTSPAWSGPRNLTRADRVIAFINQLPIVDGPAVGQRFRVDPWQEAWVRAIYEPQADDGLRIVRRAVLSVARKNAKSYLVAGLLLAHLIGPEATTNGQIYSCAVDREQAAVIFQMARKMIEMTPALQSHLRVVQSTKTIFVTRTDVKARGSVYRALSAETSGKHGLGATFFVYDEFGEARDDELWNTMFDSQQAVASPLAVVISTQNNQPTHPLSVMIDDGLRGEDPTTVCHLYAAPEGCDVTDEAAWLAANPALASWKRREPIAVTAAEAARLPAKESNFRRRYLNQRVSAIASLIPASEWRDCADSTIRIANGEEVILALDLSARNDLTALTAITTGDQIRTTTWAWKPAELLADHARRDGADYPTWTTQGHLLTSPGKYIHPQSIALKVAELVGRLQVRALVYDRWKIEELLREFDRIGLEAQVGPGDGLRLEPWGQGFREMDPAVIALESTIIDRRLTHDDNPVVNFCITNAVAISDPAGLRKLAKDKSRFRIDAAVTLAMALAFLARDRAAQGDVPTPFEDPDFEYFFG